MTAGDWRDEAACRDRAGLFFGPEGEWPDDQAAREAAARAVCEGCPVRAACLGFALETSQVHGIWGGMTEQDRRRVKRRRAARRRSAARAA